MTETRAEHNMERLQRLAHSPKEGGNLTERDLLLAENADLRRQLEESEAEIERLRRTITIALEDATKAMRAIGAGERGKVLTSLDNVIVTLSMEAIDG